TAVLTTFAEALEIPTCFAHLRPNCASGITSRLLCLIAHVPHALPETLGARLCRRCHLLLSGVPAFHFVLQLWRELSQFLQGLLLDLDGNIFTILAHLE